VSLEGQTYIITGASRGIGRCIALSLASEGVKVAIAAKSDQPHPKLPGTIHSVAEEVEKAGGKALAVKLDVRDENQCEEAVEQVAKHFGGIDGVIHCAGYIQISTSERTEPKQYDLMQAVNVRGAFFLTKACLPYLKESEHAHIISMAPPVNLRSDWLAPAAAYTVSKYGLSILTLCYAAEFKDYKISANTLWPATSIDTDAVRVHFPDHIKHSRKPDIVADAVLTILEKEPSPTGQNFIDEDVLHSIGMDDFDKYAVEPGQALTRDFFLD